MSETVEDPVCPHCLGKHPNYQSCPNYVPNFVPIVPMGLHAGHCGKCGAPFYQDSFTGVLKPICSCWNLPKITIKGDTSE